MFVLPDSARPLIESFRCAFTRPSFDRFVLLTVGTILTFGRRSVSRILWTIRHIAPGHPSSYHRFFSRARWSLWPLARALGAAVLELIDAGQPILLAVDDTVFAHKGESVYGKGCHRDAVRSTHQQTVRKWGHKWVVLAVLVRFCFASRPWALPILCALYRVPRVSEQLRCRHKTPCQLTRDLLAVLMRWFPDRRFVLTGDGGFASHDLACFCRDHHPRLTLIARMRADANLYAMPPAPHPKTIQRWQRCQRRGLPVKRHHCRKGDKLPSPANTVKAAARIRPLPQQKVRWYGDSIRQVELFSATGAWYRRHVKGGAELVRLRWVHVHDPAGDRTDWFFCTDPTWMPRRIVEGFAGRWSIEVTFEEARAHLGLETPRQWCRASVLRTAPCLLGLFSLVSLIFNEQCKSQPRPRPHQTPCYHKTQSTFADALYAVRRELWERNLLKQVIGSHHLAMLPRKIKHTLLEYLAEAA